MSTILYFLLTLFKKSNVGLKLFDKRVINIHFLPLNNGKDIKQ